MVNLDVIYNAIQEFKRGSLRKRLSDLESDFIEKDKRQVKPSLEEQKITRDLFRYAVDLKKTSAQINEVVHALGILCSLPNILLNGEKIQYLSLGAGNTGRSFDLETNKRIAEYKFIDWKGGPESIRQNGLFKDFFLLAEYETNKSKYLYVVGREEPLKFFTGGRALKSVMSKDIKLWTKFKKRFGNKYVRVREYYQDYKKDVELVDIK